MKHNENHNFKKSMEIIYNLWLCVDIRPSSHQVLEFWSSAAEAAACKLFSCVTFQNQKFLQQTVLRRTSVGWARLG